MSTHSVPRRDSRAFVALNKMYQIGGTANLNEWMNALGWSETISRFQVDVINSLTRTNMITFTNGNYVITSAALNFLGADAAATPHTAPVLTARQYSAGLAPLDVKRHFPTRLDREGSHDYQKIPSLMAGQRVAFALSISGADK